MAALSLGLLVVLALPSPAQSDQQDDPLAARSMGAADAPITVYEMSDFQCPYCRRHTLETFPLIEEEYIKTGKVRWVFINFPIPQLHPNAIAAAEVAMCSAQQDAFWPVHDLLFLHQDVWADVEDPAEFLLGLADSVGISKPQLASCLDGQEMRPQVMLDSRMAERTGATGTPAFHIEGGLLPGAYPMPIFRQILDSIYSAKTGN
jgi:protein-disulfide isomerase